MKPYDLQTTGKCIIGKPVLIVPNILDIKHQCRLQCRLQEEKVRWEQHGLELTEDVVDWAEEYATGGHYTFFGALAVFFDQLLAEINYATDMRPLSPFNFRSCVCGADVVPGLGECQQCGEQK